MSMRPATLCPAHGTRQAEDCNRCDVRHLAICAALRPDEFGPLERMVTKRALAVGQELVAEGEPGHYAFSLQFGCLKLYKSLSDGRRQITGFLLPGDFIGLPPHETYAYTAEAVTSTSVCRFPRRDFEALFALSPDLEHRFLSIVRDELVAAQDHMLLLGRRTARERLACFLNDFRERCERVGLATNPMTLPMSRSDIADYLGLTVETVSRMFSQFRKDGVLDLPRSDRVSIRDVDALAELCQGE